MAMRPPAEVLWEDGVVVPVSSEDRSELYGHVHKYKGRYYVRCNLCPTRQFAGNQSMDYATCVLDSHWLRTHEGVNK